MNGKDSRIPAGRKKEGLIGTVGARHGKGTRKRILPVLLAAVMLLGMAPAAMMPLL